MTDQTPTTTTRVEPSPQQRRLTRREDGKMLAGVCSGLGAYFGIDPILCRIGFVVLTVLTVVGGPIAYGALWLVMPRSDEPVAPSGPSPFEGTRSRTWLGIAALAGGAALLVHEAWHLDGTVVLGILAIGIGIALWSADERTAARAFPSRTPAPAAVAASGPPPDDAGRLSGGGDVPPSGPPTEPITVAAPLPPAPGRPPRARSYLGRIVIGTIAIAVGVMMVLDAAHVARIGFPDNVSWLLLIVGTGLVVGSRWGRARWLIAPGVVLAMVVGSAHSLPPDVFDGGFGEVAKRPRTIADLAPYRLTAGELTIDLSDLEVPPESEPVVDVRLGFGDLLILVPDDLAVTIDATVRGGEVNVFGRRDSGFRVHSTVTTRGEPDGSRLFIDASVGFGELTVQRVSAPIRNRSEVRSSIGRGERISIR